MTLVKFKSTGNGNQQIRRRSERGNFKDKYKRNGGETALACPECPTVQYVQSGGYKDGPGEE